MCLYNQSVMPNWHDMLSLELLWLNQLALHQHSPPLFQSKLLSQTFWQHKFQSMNEKVFILVITKSVHQKKYYKTTVFLIVVLQKISHPRESTRVQVRVHVWSMYSSTSTFQSTQVKVWVHFNHIYSNITTM